MNKRGRNVCGIDWKNDIFAAAAAIAALSLSGCLALAVPSLAYQGYKYDKKQDQSADASGSKTRKSSGSTQKVSDDDTE